MPELHGMVNQHANIQKKLMKPARKLFDKREEELQIISQSCSAGETSELFEHLGRKRNLINNQKTAINNAIGYDLNSLNEQIKDLEKHEEKRSSILKTFQSLESYESEKDKIVEKLKSLSKNSESEEEIGKLTVKQKELELKISSFETEKQLQENIENIKSNIDDLNRRKTGKGVLGDAKAKNRNVKIEITPLNKILDTDVNAYDDEIKEFEKNGYLGSFEISEIKPIDWGAVIGLFAIGIGQLIAGEASIFS
jgi:chromosome segregation ATPase